LVDGAADEGRLLCRVGAGVGDRISMDEYDSGMSTQEGTGEEMALSYDLMEVVDLVGGAEEGRFLRWWGVGGVDGVGVRTPATAELRPDECLASRIGFFDKLLCCSNFDLEVDRNARFASIRFTASRAHCCRIGIRLMIPPK